MRKGTGEERVIKTDDRETELEESSPVTLTPKNTGTSKGRD